MPTLTHWAWDSQTFVSSNVFKMSFISHANPSVINNYLVVPPFCWLFFFIYSQLINVISTCWTTHAYNCCDDNYVLESDLYIFAVTTHVVFDLRMVLLFQASLVTMKKKWLHLNCSVNLFIESSLKIQRACYQSVSEGRDFCFFIFELRKE